MTHIFERIEMYYFRRRKKERKHPTLCFNFTKESRHDHTNNNNDFDICVFVNFYLLQNMHFLIYYRKALESCSEDIISMIQQSKI